MTTETVFKTPAGEQAVMALYDEALTHWPVPYETRTIPTPYGDTFVIVSGPENLPPLVLLHGAGTNSAIWGADVAAYAQQYRVYAIDLLGEAGKSAPNRPAWDTPAYGEWLGEVLTALGVTKATFVGISQGSWTALKFAAMQPERVEKLALLTPGGIMPDKLSFILRAMVFSFQGKRGIQGMNRLLYADQPIPDGVEEITAIVMKHFKPRVGVLPIFADEQLRRLTMPVLLLGGDKDALRDLPKIAARLGALLPQLTVKIIPGAGHALLNTTGQVLEFLNAEARVQAQR